MDNADTYIRANGMQKRDALDILSKYVDKLCWSPGDLILDIGCGPGDVTADILLPRLPSNIGQVVGSDLSNAMVTHAKKSHRHPKLSFTQLDIATNTLDIDKLYEVIKDFNINSFSDGLFNKLFSFYCLHWVTEQKRAVTNMYDLIKPGGEGLVIFLARCPIFELYENLAQVPAWQTYMKDVTKYVSPYQHSIDPRSEFNDLLENAGFHVIYCTTDRRSFRFDDVQMLRKALQAVNPFFAHIPENLREDYLNNCISEVKNLKEVNLIDHNNNSNKDGQIIYVQYELIIAHFKKL